VIVWLLDLQLPKQLVSFTTNVASSNPAQAMCTRYNVLSVNWAGRLFSPGTLVSTTDKTDSHNITEILLKVAFNTITLTMKH
jgi:hypothetical protein